MAAGHACNWFLNVVLFCILFFAFGPNDYCNACINSREWLCIEKSVQPWIPYNVFSRNNMLTKSRAGYTKRRVPFYSNFWATFNAKIPSYVRGYQSNPGPKSSRTCTECSRVVARHHRATKCDSCSMWTHIKCGGVQSKQ